MKPSQLIRAITWAIQHGFSYLIVGEPGIGKTDIVHQASQLAKAIMLVMHPAVSDPTDVKGMPFARVNAGGETEAFFIPFAQLKQLMETTVLLVCFIDDLGQAPASVQAAFMQLILARELNGQKISDKVVFMAASNRKGDKAGVTGVLEPVKSRFDAIIPLEADVDDWVQWAINKGNMPSELIAFIRWRGINLLNNFQPTKDLVNSPSPRTVSHVGKMQAAKNADGTIGMPKGLESELIKGAAGAAFASEYIAFLKLYKHLPSIDKIIMTGKGDVPTDPAILYALGSILAEKMTPTNCDNIFHYMESIPDENVAAIVKDATIRNEKLTDTKPYLNWATKHGNLLFN